MRKSEFKERRRTGALDEQMRVFDEWEEVESLCRQIWQNLNDTQNG